MQITEIRNITGVGVGSCMVCRNEEAVHLMKMMDGETDLRINLCVCNRCLEIAGKNPSLVMGRFLERG